MTRDELKAQKPMNEYTRQLSQPVTRGTTQITTTATTGYHWIIEEPMTPARVKEILSQHKHNDRHWIYADMRFYPAPTEQEKRPGNFVYDYSLSLFEGAAIAEKYLRDKNCQQQTLSNSQE